MKVPRRFVDEPDGYREIPAYIPAGRPQSVQVNPEWQRATHEEDETGRIFDRTVLRRLTASSVLQGRD
jgi:hypothetical protein